MSIAFSRPRRRSPSIADRPLIDARVSRTASLALRLSLLALAIWALRRELAGVSAGELFAHLRSYGWLHAALALGCTAASFLSLGVIESMAVRSAGPSTGIPRRAAMTTAFVAHAFSQSVGLALLTGAAVRLRAYARYRLNAAAVARMSAFVTLSVTLGLLACGAVALLASSQPLRLSAATLPVRPIGLLLALVVFAYLAWSVAASRDSVGRGRWLLRRPTGRIALGQVLLSSADWLLTGTVLFAVLPAAAGLEYWDLLRVYLIAQTVGVASHIPGGVGVFEAVMITLTARGDAVRQAALVAALVMFRIIYYLLPLIGALVVAGVAELLPRRARAATLPDVVAEPGAMRRVG